ncbi:MAG: 3-hydroxyacyl-ACP dehydratase FabZ [Nitrospirae bacterium]|nr:3-hydroxyacyl-ACP dehydratase FabZ [Nitrospirota bacterium]
MEIREILKTLPHKYPFLLIDKILELEPGKRVVGIKNVTINEPFFQGHFPEYPIMPGVLIIEAMAQLGGVLAFKSNDEKDKLVYFLGIDKAKFRKPVFPGDQIRLEVELIQQRVNVWKLKGSAFVEDKLVCEAELMAMITDKTLEK